MSKYLKFKKHKTLLIKIDDNIPRGNKFNDPFEILVKFKTDPNGSWYYHVPQRAFNNQDQIIEYFLKNQESEWLKIKVKKLENKGL